MKVNLVNSHETSGGAAIATLRLLRGLNKIENIDANLFCQHTSFSLPKTIGPNTEFDITASVFRPYLNRLIAIKDGQNILRNHQFSPAYLPMRQKYLHAISDCDVVHLNWINNGFISIRNLNKISAPIIWTLHDMWTMTGGCHYSGNCDRYLSSCGKCPPLNSTNSNDLSAKLIKQKIKNWSNLPLTIVCPSKWLANCAKKSTVLKNKRIEIIPNGIDTNAYKPTDKRAARIALNLPQNKKLVLFNALNALHDLRKGLDVCLKTMECIVESGRNDIELVVLGEFCIDSLNLTIPTHCLGKLSDEISISMVYSAVDIYFNPSKQDNLPNTILEAMSSGVPCVASDIGGFPDLITNGENGYLGNPSDYKYFSQHILSLVSDANMLESFSINARNKILNSFNINAVSQQYLNLYKEIKTSH